jgi:hypothetical protein
MPRDRRFCCYCCGLDLVAGRQLRCFCTRASCVLSTVEAIVQFFLTVITLGLRHLSEIFYLIITAPFQWRRQAFQSVGH